MNVSFDLNYFISQMKNTNDQEFFNEYYNHFQIHLEHVKKYIEIKQNFHKYLQTKLDTHIITSEELEIYQKLHKELEYSIDIITEDARNYKDKFRDHLFYLIKK